VVVERLIEILREKGKLPATPDYRVTATSAPKERQP
jgi:hypothetical protein